MKQLRLIFFLFISCIVFQNCTTTPQNEQNDDPVSEAEQTREIWSKEKAHA